MLKQGIKRINTEFIGICTYVLTTLSFEPSFLWIHHQPSQTRWFNSRQHGLNSTWFLVFFHTCSVKSFSKFLKITWILAFLFLSEIPKKVFQGNLLKFCSNQDIENLKYQDLDYLVGTMLSIWKKNNGLYVSVRSWKRNLIIKNWGIDYLAWVMFVLDNSVMVYLVWRLLYRSRIFIIIDNMCQQNHRKNCIN